MLSAQTPPMLLLFTFSFLRCRVDRLYALDEHVDIVNLQAVELPVGPLDV
jgi:hypothetical protein